MADHRVDAKLDTGAAPGEDHDAKQEIDEAKGRAELEKLRLENQGLRDDNAARKKYADRIFVFIAIWLFLVLLIVIVQGFSGQEGSASSFEDRSLFDLDSKVILMLLGTTTANVVGLFIVVARYLFPEKK